MYLDIRILDLRFGWVISHIITCYFVFAAAAADASNNLSLCLSLSLYCPPPPVFTMPTARRPPHITFSKICKSASLIIKYTRTVGQIVQADRVMSCVARRVIIITNGIHIHTHTFPHGPQPKGSGHQNLGERYLPDAKWQQYYIIFLLLDSIVAWMRAYLVIFGIIYQNYWNIMCCVGPFCVALIEIVIIIGRAECESANWVDIIN